MKKACCLVPLLVAFLFAATNVYAQHDGHECPTWKADGKYIAGSCVLLDAKIGSSVGPYYNLTGGNAGRPDLDNSNITASADWFYCCGTPFVSSNGAVVSGTANNVTVANANTTPNGYSSNAVSCVPMFGSVTQPASPSYSLQAGYQCTDGGLGKIPTPVNVSSPSTGEAIFSVSIQPPVPNDGSQLHVWPVITDAAGDSIYDYPGNMVVMANGPGSAGSNPADADESLIISTMGFPWASPMLAGIAIQYEPGNLNLQSFTIRSLHWSLTAAQ